MQATTTATVAAAASLAQRWSQAAIAVACNMAGNILAMYWLKSYACDWQQQQQRSVCSFWSFTNRNCIDFAVAAASAAVAADVAAVSYNSNIFGSVDLAECLACALMIYRRQVAQLSPYHYSIRPAALSAFPSIFDVQLHVTWRSRSCHWPNEQQCCV